MSSQGNTSNTSNESTDVSNVAYIKSALRFTCNFRLDFNIHAHCPSFSARMLATSRWMLVRSAIFRNVRIFTYFTFLITIDLKQKEKHKSRSSFHKIKHFR